MNCRFANDKSMAWTHFLDVSVGHCPDSGVINCCFSGFHNLRLKADSFRRLEPWPAPHSDSLVFDLARKSRENSILTSRKSTEAFLKRQPFHILQSLRSTRDARKSSNDFNNAANKSRWHWFKRLRQHVAWRQKCLSIFHECPVSFQINGSRASLRQRHWLTFLKDGIEKFSFPIKP